jgi:hypothetical protein
MTYQQAGVADIINTGGPASYASGADIVSPIIGTSGRTNATISSNQITLTSGSHWRLEWSPSQSIGATGSTTFEAQFYSVTDGAYVGQSTFAGSQNADLRKCRIVATHFILSSEITTSITLECRLKSCTTNLIDGDVYEISDKSTLRIFEVPA